MMYYLIQLIAAFPFLLAPRAARAPQPATPVIGFVSRTPSAPTPWPVAYTLILTLCLTVRG